jgi:SynChlorMet cassette protein ScmD
MLLAQMVSRHCRKYAGCGSAASLTGSACRPCVSLLNKGAETVEQKNPIANPLIVLREEFDDWAILFDPDTGNAFGLNPTGVFIWKLLDGKHDADAIVSKLREEADDVPEDAAEHARQFIASLEQQGLVGYEVIAGSPA